MSTAKKIAWGVGVLLALVAVALGVLVATFDADRAKALAIDAVQQKYQRTLRIDGPVGLSVFPRLAVKVGKLRLSERARADDFAAVEEAAVGLELLPLLKKQVAVDRIALRGVRATYTRNAKGASNVDDLLARDSAAPADAAQPLPAIDIAAIRIDDARLTLRDDLSGTAGTLTLRSLETGRVADGVASAVKLDLGVELSRPQAIKLDLAGNAKVTPKLASRAVAVTDAKLELRGDTPQAKALSATLQGALAWEGDGLSAGPLTLAVASAKLGALTVAPSKAEVKRLVYRPAARQLEVEALALALAGQQGTHGFDLELAWPKLAAQGEQIQGSALTAKLRTRGANTLTAQLTSQAPAGSFEAMRLPGTTLTLDGSAGARKVQAKLGADLLLRPTAAQVTLERLQLDANVADPALQPIQLAASGSASAGAKAAQWNLAGRINAERFETSGTAQLGGAVPRLQASARLDTLDFNKLLARDAGAAAPAAAAPADTPVDLAGLRAIDGRFTVAANRLVFRQYRVDDARLDAALDGGALRIARIAGRAWGGTVDGSGSADARSQRIGIDLAANGVNVNALLLDVAGKDLLEGTGRVTAKVTTGGASLGALRSGLAGHVALNVRDGAIKGINLARTLRQAKAALTMKQDAVTKARSAEKTDFSELTATARIEGGVARSDDLDLKSPFLRLGGAGTFDIGRGRIDYTARATVIGSPVGQDGAELAALKGLTVPVHLSGPFEAIDWKVQWSAVAMAAAQSQLKDKLLEKLGAKPAAGGASAPAQLDAKDKLKDRLKGLFGR